MKRTLLTSIGAGIVAAMLSAGPAVAQDAIRIVGEFFAQALVSD